MNLEDCNKFLTENQLKASISDIVKRSNNPGKPVGILTGNDRDTWAENHEILKGKSNNIFCHLTYNLVNYYLYCLYVSKLIF